MIVVFHDVIPDWFWRTGTSDDQWCVSYHTASAWIYIICSFYLYLCFYTCVTFCILPRFTYLSIKIVTMWPWGTRENLVLFFFHSRRYIPKHAVNVFVSAYLCWENGSNMDCKTSRFSFANQSPKEQKIITNQTYIYIWQNTSRTWLFLVLFWFPKNLTWPYSWTMFSLAPATNVVTSIQSPSWDIYSLAGQPPPPVSPEIAGVPYDQVLLTIGFPE